MMVRETAPFVPGETKIPLNVPSYGPEEVVEALDSLTSGWVTMGKKVQQFEKAWAEYIGVRHAVMTNSGSSANLIALSVMRQDRAGEIITPALTWATTAFPIAQSGFLPVLVDVDPVTYNIDPEQVEAAITKKTRAIMPVHLLGNPCDMMALRDIANKHDLVILEDACEAHGAEDAGRKVGSIGLAGTFSFFFSHHISTVEGGMIVTDDDEFADRCRALRAFGWIRDINKADRDAYAQERADIDPRFLFQWPGFNVRPMEVQGAFGIHQVPRLEGYIRQRQENANYWHRKLSQYDSILLQTERAGSRHVWFSYPVMVAPGAGFTAKELQAHLESRGLETRPIEAGNIAIQPAMKRLKHRALDVSTAQYIHENAFFFGNHHGIGEQEREAVAGYFHEFMEKVR
jgi:CDP-4-dehydro-6-deoxyglucose reductase, E1